LWQTGCVPEKASPPSTSDSEKVEPNSDNQVKVVIPSDLDPAEVMARFVPYMPPWGESVTKQHSFWATEFGIDYPHEGFISGFSTSWHGSAHWPKKDGGVVGFPNDLYGFLLSLTVLKYRKPEFAREDYERISTKQKFEMSVFDDVEVKTKNGLPPLMRLWLERYNDDLTLEEEQYDQYFLNVSNFIIYAYGLKEVTRDAVIRLIDHH